jgi:chloramphenicol-sensitive protein RarD
MRKWQWVPVGIASMGVIYLTIDYGRLPWIALILAITFALYAVVKKVAPLGALSGLTLETTILVLPAAIYLLSAEIRGVGVFGHSGVSQAVLLMMAGLVTAVPLLLFGAAARLIPLSTIGILQYLAPSCQFLLGIIVFQEPFTTTRLVGFAIIWLALILFWTEGFLNSRQKHLDAFITAA